METKPIIITAAVVILVIIGMAFLQNSNTATPQTEDSALDLDAFATCIAESGATFYGAYWCSHCNAQKEAFGSSAKLLPYVECATPAGNGQVAACTEAEITGYPTWVFADGTRQSGRISLEGLAEKTLCELPTQS